MSADSPASTSQTFELDLSRDIAAPPAAVWAVLTDIEDAPARMQGIEAVELLTEGDYRVGTRWRETRRMLGRSDTWELTVTEAVPNRRTVITASAHGMDYRTTFSLTPEMGGRHTRITMEFRGTGERRRGLTGLVGRVLQPIGVKAIRTAMVQDLADIAAAAENRPPVRH